MQLGGNRGGLGWRSSPAASSACSQAVAGTFRSPHGSGRFCCCISRNPRIGKRNRADPAGACHRACYQVDRHIRRRVPHRRGRRRDSRIHPDNPLHRRPHRGTSPQRRPVHLGVSPYMGGLRLPSVVHGLRSWGSIAYTQYGNLPLSQITTVTGLFGLTFIIAWFASALEYAVSHPDNLEKRCARWHTAYLPSPSCRCAAARRCSSKRRTRIP